MNPRIAAALFAVVVSILEPPALARAGQKAAPRSAPWIIQSDRLGPFRLGTKEADLLQIARTEGIQARRRIVRQEGEEYAEILISRAAKPLARLELDNRRLYRIVVLSSSFATADGARVGDRFAALAKRCGKGTVGVGEGTVCILWPRKPGLSFCLPPSARLLKAGPPSWSLIQRINPRVDYILIVGAAP